MAAFTFNPVPATKQQARLKMALVGVSGSGKTFTALSLATHLVPNGKICVVDTERGSASKYAGEFGFQVVQLEDAHPNNFIECIYGAQEAGFDVLVIDSLSHAWSGRNGALELVDRASKRNQGSGNNFGAWRDVTPLHNALIDAMVASKIHIIATMRAKTEYTQERDERTGRTVVRKIGLAPVQRNEMEYEFDVVGDIDQDHNLIISKTRCSAIAEAVINKPGKELAESLRTWLTDGVPESLPEPPPAPEPVPVPDLFAKWAYLCERGRHWGIKTNPIAPDTPIPVLEKWSDKLYYRIEEKREFAGYPSRAMQQSGEFEQFMAAVNDAGLSFETADDLRAFEIKATVLCAVSIKANEVTGADWREFAGAIDNGSLEWSAAYLEAEPAPVEAAPEAAAEPAVPASPPETPAKAAVPPPTASKPGKAKKAAAAT